MKRIGIVAATVALVVTAFALHALIVSAHASLVSSTPTDKQVLATAPTAVSLTFTDNLKPAPGSFIQVTGSGKDVTAGASAVSKSDTKTMTVPLQANLPAGQYTVFWKSTSADDGGVTFGRYTFFVGTPNPSDVATAAAGVAVAIPDAAKSQALSGGSGNSNTGLIIGIIIAASVGLIVGTGAGAFAARRR
ncbi:MAG TPA: copper resistance protein CopC [Dehalococcoidia bacterium]|nr:copper resistance protein CopC [Dehalococcoidia bacterium]